MHFWLIKSESSVFSIHDLAKAKHKTTHWEGVRNYQAITNLFRGWILRRIISVPHGFITKDGYKLGSWVREQRKHKDPSIKRRGLSIERVKLLESFKGWSWDVSEAQLRSWLPRLLGAV